MTPWSVRFGIFLSSLRPGCGLALLPGDGLDTRDVAPHFAHARGIFELTGRPLEAQVELLLLELERLVVELVDGHVPDIFGLHVCSSTAIPRCARRSAS